MINSDPRRTALSHLLTSLESGAPVDPLEGRLLDCKADVASEGSSDKEAGLVQDRALAKLIADAAACFANAEGGVVVLGVKENGVGPGTITGTAVDDAWLTNRIFQLIHRPVIVETFHTQGERCLAVFVEPAPFPIKDTQGGYRRRQGRDCQEMSGAELGSFSVARQTTDWSAAVSASTEGETDLAAMTDLRRLLQATQEVSRVSLANAPDGDLLRALGLVHQDGLHLNRAGELLCIRTPGRLALVDLICKDAVGGDSTFHSDFSGQPVLLALQEAFHILDARIAIYDFSRGGVTLRQEPALPVLARREAIVNAVTHRDWAQSHPITILLEGARLTVSSPGGFLFGISASTILTAPAQSRNRALASAFRSLRLAESEGTGVDRMFREMVRLGLEVPRIQEAAQGSRVVCVLEGGKPDENVIQAITQLPTNAQSDVDLNLILYLLQGKPTLNASELAPIIQKDKAAALAAFRRAKELGILDDTPHEGRCRLSANFRRILAPRLKYLRRTDSDYKGVISHFLSVAGQVRARDLIETFGITSVTASRILNQQTEEGFLRRVGSRGPGVRYIKPSLDARDDNERQSSTENLMQ